MQPEAWKQIGEFLKSSLPVLGSLIGVYVGAKLSRSGERKQWLNDCRKDEFKELVTTLTRASMALIKQYDKVHAASPYMRSLQTLKDRIFIADDLGKMKIFERWTDSIQALNATEQYDAFERTAEEIRNDLVQAAKQPL